ADLACSCVPGYNVIFSRGRADGPDDRLILRPHGSTSKRRVKKQQLGWSQRATLFPPADKNASSARNGRTLPLGASQESGLTPQSKPIKCRTVLKSGLERTWEFMPPRPGSAMILRATTGCICQ